MAYYRPTREAARGKWRGVLLEIGVPNSALTGKHVPCPMCGGKDRFRFDNKDGDGTWLCSHCGAGDGLKFVEEFLKLDFPEAATKVDHILGNVTIKTEVPKETLTEERRLASLREVARSTVKISKGDLADVYFASRGIDEAICYPKVLRFSPSLRDGEGAIRPAIVATVQAPDGSNISLHRTFLRNDGGAKAEMECPRKLMPGGIGEGSAIRLSEWMGGALGVAEGIETAMSASILFEMPVWALISAGNLEKWTAPEGCNEVVIFGDNDLNFRGQAAAYTLAYRLRSKVEHVSVMFPKTIGTDWNDELLSRKT